MRPEAGGRHSRWGTRNALARPGPRVYLEVIAADPAAPEPEALIETPDGPVTLTRGTPMTVSGSPAPGRGRHATPLHRRLTLGMQTILLLGTGIAVWQGQWLGALTTATILLVTLLPVVLGRRFRVFIPPEFEALAVVFIFASLFLGEVRGYYVRFWWWDTLLHTVSGFLLGVTGFLLVHVLNEKEDVALDMKPGFVALFAFVFAVALGAIWEIFEFAMDAWFGLNMQKSGLFDTMWDLIVDTVGAGVIAVLGYGWLRTAGNESFLERWIEGFVEANPRLFGGEG